jgi:hypothetical protein
MNDTLIQIIASQLGIPSSVVDELKASKPRLIHAQFSMDAEPILATLTVEVTGPKRSFPVVITLPLDQLKRIAPIYDKAVKLASAEV